MRLIDAEPLIRHLKNWQRELDENSNREYNLLELVIRGIENEPVTYDLDEVVRRMEEMGDIKFSSFSEPLIAVKDVLKILKSGEKNNE